MLQNAKIFDTQTKSNSISLISTEEENNKGPIPSSLFSLHKIVGEFEGWLAAVRSSQIF